MPKASGLDWGGGFKKWPRAWWGSVREASDFGSGRDLSSSPTSDSVLTAQSLEPASESVSPSLSAPSCLYSVSLSLSQK